jgi:tetratricopeptide (TPR) repeat protein
MIRAFDYYAEAGDTPQAVAIADYPLMLGFGEPGTAQLSKRALALVPSDALEAGRLLCRYGLSLYLETGDYQSAQEALEEALAIGRREKDRGLELRALADAAHVDWDASRPQESADKNLQAIELARSLGDSSAEASAHAFAAAALLIMGELKASWTHTTAALEQFERLRDRAMVSTTLQSAQLASALEGTWGSAREFGDRGLTLEPSSPFFLRSRTLLEFETGNFTEGETYIERFLQAMHLVPAGPNIQTAMVATLLPVVARITGDTHQIDVAEDAAETVLSAPSLATNLVVYARMGAALIAVIQRDVKAAADHYAALLHERNRFRGHMNADRTLGLLTQTMGRLDDAIVHFEETVAFCRKAGYRPELAWSLCDYADLLLQQNSPGDRVKAMSLLDESLAISRELGMTPLMERVLSRREILKA